MRLARGLVVLAAVLGVASVAHAGDDGAKAGKQIRLRVNHFVPSKAEKKLDKRALVPLADAVCQALPAKGWLNCLGPSDREALTQVHALQMLTGPCDDCQSGLRKMSKADYVVTGEVSPKGDGFSLHLKLVRAADNAVLAEATVDGKDRDGLRDGATDFGKTCLKKIAAIRSGKGAAKK